MKKFKKNPVVILLLLITLAANMGGCGKKNTSEEVALQKNNAAMGRYIENEIEMPKLEEGEYVFQLEKNDEGYPVFYSCQMGENKKGVHKYIQTEKGEWEKKSIPWLEDVSVADPGRTKILFGPNGEQYFYQTAYKDDSPYPYLIKTIDGKHKEEIQLEGWESGKDEETSSESKIYLWDVAILKNGNIVCIDDQGRSAIYDKDTYQICTEGTHQDQHHVDYKELTALGENYMMLSSFDTNETPTALSFYDSSNKLIQEVPFNASETYDNPLLYSEDNGSVVMCNRNGIHVLPSQSQLWETVVDGELTSLSQPSLYAVDMIKASNNVYYILYESQSLGSKLMKYTYDQTIPTTPGIELSIYSLGDNASIREAISLYQRNNPNVKVMLRVSRDEESTTSKTDSIKALNTEILSGNGPDLILLDGLPVSSYLEKGALEDLSDIILPIVGEELLPNIVDNYKTHEHIYSVPARFTLPILYGYTEVVNDAKDLDGLITYINRNPKAKLFGKLSYSDLIEQLLPTEIPKFLDASTGLKRQELTAFLEKLKIISDTTQCVEAYEEEKGYRPNIWGLASNENEITLEEVQGIYGASYDLAMVDYIKGKFDSYQNAFTAVGEIGVNASSKQKELAKEFVRILLCEEVQELQLFDGFPINTKALEGWRTKEESNFSAVTEIKKADGTSTEFVIQYAKPEHREQLVAMCKNVSKKTVQDDILSEIIKEETTKFLKDEITAEQVTDAIMDRAKLYLTE